MQHTKLVVIASSIGITDSRLTYAVLNGKALIEPSCLRIAYVVNEPTIGVLDRRTIILTTVGSVYKMPSRSIRPNKHASEVLVIALLLFDSDSFGFSIGALSSGGAHFLSLSI